MSTIKIKSGISHLFPNDGVSIEFLQYCKKSEEFSELGLERIENALFLPMMDNFDEYIHHILDWLEEKGYYIGLPLRGKFKYVTVCHFKDKVTVHKTPIYSNSGVNDRRRALELGVINCIEHYLKNKISNTIPLKV